VNRATRADDPEAEVHPRGVLGHDVNVVQSRVAVHELDPLAGLDGGDARHEGASALIDE